MRAPEDPVLVRLDQRSLIFGFGMRLRRAEKSIVDAGWPGEELIFLRLLVEGVEVEEQRSRPRKARVFSVLERHRGNVRQRRWK